MRTPLFLAATLVIAGTCAAVPLEFGDGPRMNQIQVLGTHNSYHKRGPDLHTWTAATNTTATIYVPAAGPDAVTEAGSSPAGDAEAVKLVGTEPGCVVYEIGSGDYLFASVL